MSWCPPPTQSGVRGSTGHTLRGLCVTPASNSCKGCVRESFVTAQLLSRDFCGTCMLLPVGMQGTRRGCHSGSHHASLCAALAILYISTRVVSLHRLCVCVKVVSHSACDTVLSFKVYVHVGGLSFPAKDEPRDHSQSVVTMWLCYTVPEGVPRCCGQESKA